MTDNTNSYNSSREEDNIEVTTDLNSPPLNNYTYWNISTINVRGLNDPLKQERLFSFLSEYNFDFCGITETWLKPANYIKDPYNNFQIISTTPDPDNYFGTGVSLAIQNEWTKHIFQKKMHKNRGIMIDLSLKKGKKIRIIVVYYPANPQNKKEESSSLFAWTKETITEALRKQYHIITMGDLNTISDPLLDSNSATPSAIKNPTIELFTTLNFTDTFRYINPGEKTYTWIKKGAGRRLDYIWTSDTLTSAIIDSTHEPMSTTIDSDHKLVSTILNMGPIENKKLANYKNETQTFIDFKNSTGKQWDTFTNKVEIYCQELNAKTPSATIDQLWTWFKDNIMLIGKQTLKIRKVKKHSKYTTKNYNNNKTKNLRNISTLYKTFTKWTCNPETQTQENRDIINNTLADVQTIYPSLLNPPLDRNISSISDPAVREWIKELRTLYFAEKKITKQLFLKEQKEKIRNNIQKRFKDLQDSPKKMINSILNIKKRSIITDRLCVKSNNEIDIITDPDQIKSHVKKHFQDWTRKRTPLDINKNDRWKAQYEPKSTINNEWYQNLSVPITAEEVKNNLNKKNNFSAPGNSNIPYILLKKLKTNGIATLTNLFNSILQTGVVPKEWKKGNIYPIPKPKEWMGDINITRPITLLETARKLFTSILNNRLADTLTSHQILSDNNWAGLPNGSTQQPIHILNNIIEEAIELKKELWIVSQDISKAFDSVNTNMLTAALHRIKVPNNIIRIITNLLTDRENTVITASGLTEAYTVEDGIDQGDTISPLLWRIFYDPLLQEVEDSCPGYSMKTEWITSLNPYTTNQLTQKITGTAYMDDTTWFAGNREDTQHTLDIASSFFQINDIKVNVDKSKLTCINTESEDRNKGLVLCGDTLHPTEKHEPVRILGVWISESGNKKHQKNLIKECINKTIKILKWKSITDKQCRYIINQVLFPRIEYLLNDLVLTEQECNVLNGPITKVFKHKAGLPASTINSIIHAPFGYKVFNLWDRQIHTHATKFFNRLNDSDMCASTTKIRLQQLQNTFWSTNSILHNKLPFWTSSRKRNLNNDILNMLKVQGITFTTTFHHQICETINNRGTPIEAFMGSSWYNKHRKDLRNRQIIYCEQVMSPTLSQTLAWHQIKKRSAQGKTPKWFTSIHQKIQETIQETGWQLTETHTLYDIFAHIPKRSKKEKRKNPLWSAAKIQNSKQPVLLRRAKLGTDNQSICRHITKNVNESPLFKCKGCSLNDSNVRKEYKDQQQCLLKINNDELIPIPVTKTTISSRSSSAVSSGHSTPAREYTNRLQMTAEDIAETIDKKLKTIQEISQAVREQKPVIHLDNFTESKHLLKKTILTSEKTFEKLIFITTSLMLTDNLQIYTDGSLEQHANHCTMGLGWVIYNQEGKTLAEFKGKTDTTPSSTKAELTAILVATLTIPHNKKVEIITDSANAINILNKALRTTGNESTAHQKNANKKLLNKAHNRILATTIIEILRKKNIQYRLTKVKSHTGNRGNDRADSLARISLAKEDRDDITFNLKNSTSNKVLIRWNQKELDVPVSTLVKKIANKKWTSKWRAQNRTNTWLSNKKCYEINWDLTFKTLHPSQITNTHTDFQDSVDRSFRHKTYFKELPTLNQLHIRRPDLYKIPTCITCGKTKEDDLHPFTCNPKNIQDLKDSYISFLSEECAARADGNKQRTDIRTTWRNTQIYNTNNNANLTDEVTFLDIIRGNITNKMIEVATSITNNITEAKKAITVATNKFWEKKKEVWKDRCNTVITWEKTQGINKKDKKNKKYPKKKYTKEESLRTKTFQEKYITLTNSAMTEYINNTDRFFNFLSKFQC
jgi:ribonuclease HI